MRFLRLGGAPLAIIAVSFSVAAAHRNVGLIANLRNANACAGNVGAGALARLRLAPQTRGAWDIGDTAASLADTGGAAVLMSQTSATHVRAKRAAIGFGSMAGQTFCRKKRAAWMGDARRI